MKVAFIGLGNMGEPIARNLLAAGHEVIAYNRTRSRAEELSKAGARVTASAGVAAAQAEVAMTMLADDSAVEQVVFGPGGVLDKLPPGAVHVSLSTISVDFAERLTAAHAQRGQQYISAPVFGRPGAATEGKLFVVAAGAKSAVERCQPLFDAIGQRTFMVGEQPSAANVVKVAGNFMVACVIEGLGEAIALGRKHGIEASAFVEMMTASIFPAPVYKIYGQHIADENFEPAGFRLALGLKDVRLALAAAEKAAVPMPFASVLRDRALSGMARGMADLDWSSMARLAAEAAGLEPVKRK
jgi:3-hydroxyisobutyrate dehydrogenase-like beta-hydroxyacid dehydrogenase